MKFASYEPETFGTDTRKGWAWVQGDF
jgi:hypothetical protein